MTIREIAELTDSETDELSIELLLEKQFENKHFEKFQFEMLSASILKINEITKFIRDHIKYHNDIIDLENKNLEELKNFSDIFQEEIKDQTNDINIKQKRTNINKATRYFIFKKAGFKCQCCGMRPSSENDIQLNIDHIIPFSKGGKNSIENYQVLCNKCNASKSNFDDIDLSIKELKL